MGQALPRRIGRHTHPAVKPPAGPPKASGIDYLALVRDRFAQQEQQRLGRISYRKFAATDEKAANSPEEDPQ